MKILLDENLSPRLTALLGDLFDEIVHVKDVDLQSATDSVIWTYARENSLIIISKDADFRQMSFVHGHPPKVVAVTMGNCSTADIAMLLRENHTLLESFSENLEESFLVLHLLRPN